MSRLAVPRLLLTGAVVTASTAIRVGGRCAGLAARRTPSLLELAARAVTADGADGRSHAELRDGLIALFRDSAEASWVEIRRGVDDFDVFTRPDEDPSAPRRRYRVKP